MKLLLLGLVFWATGAFADPVTTLELFGSPASWVVGNQTLVLTPADGYGFTGTIFDQGFGRGADLELAVVSSPDPFVHWFYLDMAMPQGQPLAAGLYTGATRYPFEASGTPGLTLEGDGRGDDISTGYFEIQEISYSGDQLLSLAADFVQFDEGHSDWISSGIVRFNSDIPLDAAPEPVTLILVCCGLGIVAVVRRGKKAPMAG